MRLPFTTEGTDEVVTFQANDINELLGKIVKYLAYYH